MLRKNSSSDLTPDQIKNRAKIAEETILLPTNIDTITDPVSLNIFRHPVLIFTDKKNYFRVELASLYDCFKAKCSNECPINRKPVIFAAYDTHLQDDINSSEKYSLSDDRFPEYEAGKKEEMFLYIQDIIKKNVARNERLQRAEQLHRLGFFGFLTTCLRSCFGSEENEEADQHIRMPSPLNHF